MSLTSVLIAAAIVGITGMIIGLLLGFAAEKFKVEVDEKEVAIRELLPGNNCGGCGYAGCDGLAKAISQGLAPVNACPVAGEKTAEAIADLMGVENASLEKEVAFVKCAGTCEKTHVKYNYYGIKDCKKMAAVPGQNDKMCSYGCMGFGSCVKVCPFDAIHIINGIAKVDKEKCKACSLCVAECPSHLIELVPYSATQLVQCSSKDKGKDVKAACSIGCIGCMLCVKVCEDDAIHVVENIAYIDQSKCSHCGKCAVKCPTKVILNP